MKKNQYLAAILWMVTTLSLSAATIRGVIRDVDTGEGIEDISVTVVGTALRTNTDRFGRYQLSLVNPGEVTLKVGSFSYEDTSRAISVDESGATADFELVYAGTILELDEFTVKASESASSRALNKQRAADVRLDIIASDKFGKLPDLTIADAVRRLPGVTVEKDSQGRAGRYVTIRGMNSDFNAVNINGQKVVVSNFDGASRSVPLDIIASNSADMIEVTKAPLPSDSADSIGGVINIRSASTFDEVNNAYRLESTLSRIELADAYTGPFPHDQQPIDLFLQASLYLDKGRTLGNLISVSYNRTPYLFESMENGPYRLSDGVYFPTYGRLEEAFDNVEILSFTDRLDFAPNEHSLYSVELTYSERETQQGSWRTYVNYDPDYLVGDDPIVKGDTAVQFTSDDRVYKEVRDYFETQKNLNLVFKGEHRFEDYEIDYSLGINNGEFQGDPNKDTRAIFRTSFWDTEYDNTDGTPQYGDRIVEEPNSEFSIYEVRKDTRRIDDDTISAQLNIHRHTQLGKVPTTFSAGLAYSQTKRDFDDIRHRFATADVDWTLDEVRIGDDVIYGSILADYGKDQSVNGQSAPSFIDPVKIREVEQILIQRGIQDEGDGNWYTNQNAARDARSDLVNSYELEENILAAYVMGKSSWEKLSIVYGLRLESTDVSVSTYGGDFYESDPDSGLYVHPVKGENDYVDFFPHLHLRYDATADTIYRFSMNRTLARPSFRQLNPSEDIDPTANGDMGLVIKGKTQLDAVYSTNLDLSVDHYFAKSGNITAGVFYKQMDNNVYRLSRPVLASDPDYYPETAEVREFLNADGATVMGFEFGFYLPLDIIHEAMKGFTLKGNYTYTDSKVDGIQRMDRKGILYLESGETPLFGQVSDAINLGIGYVVGGFEGNIDWHWTGAYLDFGGIDLDANLDDYIDDRSNLDLNISYLLGRNWKVFFKVKNLLDEEISTYEGNRNRMFYVESTGRVFYLGFSWNR